MGRWKRCRPPFPPPRRPLVSKVGHKASTRALPKARGNVAGPIWRYVNEARGRLTRASSTSASPPSPLVAECGTGLGGVGGAVDRSVSLLEAGSPEVTTVKRKRRCTEMTTRSRTYGCTVTGRPEKVIPSVCQAMTLGPPTRGRGTAGFSGRRDRPRARIARPWGRDRTRIPRRRYPGPGRPSREGPAGCTGR